MNKNSFIQSLKIAATYIGTVVGAGFATGREIVEFFTQYGYYGTIGIICSGILFTILGIKIMEICSLHRIKNNYEFCILLFGNRFGKVINLIMSLMLIGVAGVMISGAGAIFSEQLNISRVFGISIFIVLSFLIISRDIKGLHAINSFVVPLMILFSLSIILLSFNNVNLLFEPQPNSNGFWFTKSLSYVAYNLTLSIAVFAPIASTENNKKILINGSIIGSFGLTVLLLFNHYSISTLPNFNYVQIPTAEILHNKFPILHVLFVLVILGEILTTLVANGFGLVKLMETKMRSNNVSLIIILVIATSISFFQYKSLLGTIYPAFGALSLLLVIKILYFRNKV
ncbi:MAG: putative rane protein [Bacillales bacterium]|jgi:uncharacterized membrane protein YkvI|nr:putative rane protein [Bacillales bacterium]